MKLLIGCLIQEIKPFVAKNSCQQSKMNPKLQLKKELLTCDCIMPITTFNINLKPI